MDLDTAATGRRFQIRFTDSYQRSRLLWRPPHLVGSDFLISLTWGVLMNPDLEMLPSQLLEDLAFLPVEGSPQSMQDLWWQHAAQAGWPLWHCSWCDGARRPILSASE